MERWRPVPKVAAALLAGLAVILLAFVATLAGIDIMDDATKSLAIIVAALVPAVAGWVKED